MPRVVGWVCGCGDPYCRRGCFGSLGAGPDLIAAGQQVLSDTTLAFLQSPQFTPFLEAVKNKAREGVIEETKSNAFTLLALAAGAGAVGGFIFQGPRGMVLGGVLAAWAVDRLIKGHP